MVTIKQATIYPNIKVLCKDYAGTKTTVALSAAQAESLNGVKYGEMVEALKPMVPEGTTPFFLTMTVPFFLMHPKKED